MIHTTIHSIPLPHGPAADLHIAPQSAWGISASPQNAKTGTPTDAQNVLHVDHTKIGTGIRHPLFNTRTEIDDVAGRKLHTDKAELTGFQSALIGIILIGGAIAVGLYHYATSHPSIYGSKEDDRTPHEKKVALLLRQLRNNPDDANRLFTDFLKKEIDDSTDKNEADALQNLVAKINDTMLSLLEVNAILNFALEQESKEHRDSLKKLYRNLAINCLRYEGSVVAKGNQDNVASLFWDPEASNQDKLLVLDSHDWRIDPKIYIDVTKDRVTDKWPGIAVSYINVGIAMSNPANSDFVADGLMRILSRIYPKPIDAEQYEKLYKLLQIHFEFLPSQIQSDVVEHLLKIAPSDEARAELLI